MTAPMAQRAKAGVKSLICLAVFSALWIGGASTAHAADFRSDKGRQDIQGSIDDDLYVAGETVSISAVVTGDTVGFARRVVLSGASGGSFLAGAETVGVSGVVSHSARVGARTVDISGSVGGDLMAGAQSVLITKTGMVSRDVLAGAQEVQVEGRVGRDIRGNMELLSITGVVEGDIDVEADRVELGPGARVTGDLLYASATEAKVDSSAVVGGRVQRREPTKPARGQEPGDLVLKLLGSLLGTLLMGLVLLWLVPGPLSAMAQTIRTSPWPTLGVGVVALIVIPIVVIVLLIAAGFAGAGFSIPIALAAVYAILLMLARLIVGFSIGLVILRVGRGVVPPFGKAFLALALGVIILALLGIVPVLGVIVSVLVGLMAMGAGVLAFSRWRRGGQPPEPAAPEPAAPEPAPAPTT